MPNISLADSSGPPGERPAVPESNRPAGIAEANPAGTASSNPAGTASTSTTGTASNNPAATAPTNAVGTTSSPDVSAPVVSAPDARAPDVSAITDPLELWSQDGDDAKGWRIVELRARTTRGNWERLDLAPDAPVPGIDRPTTLQSESGHAVELSLQRSFHGVTLRLEAEPSEIDWLAVDLRATEAEHYVGFGERFDTVDQRGKQIDLRVINGAVRDLTYKPIPFFMSTAGYAARILGDSRSVVRVAVADDPGVVSIRVAGSELGLRLYHGPNLKELLGHYTADIGRPQVPPAWVFGPWKSRDWTAEDQATVLEDVRLGREHDLAGTVKLIDATWEPETHTFTFDGTKYPDPKAMIEEVTRLGYRLVLWVSPFMVHGLEPSDAYLEAARNGYLIKDPDGEVYVHRLGNSPTYLGSCIDFTNPEAIAWWKENIRRLAQMGVAGFKTDFGEQVPDDALFFDGRRGHEVRNVYPRLYNEATLEALREVTDGVLLARSAWDGSQSLSAIWAGDQTSDFGPASGLPSVIVAGQTAGLSGFPYWASDIGGYFGVPSDEVFTRWTQFGAFSPIMQVHGMGKREPWLFEPDTLASYRRYAQLHLDLFPYLYSLAVESNRTGLPLMRALCLEFENEADAWSGVAEHQFMLGSDLLVAPVAYGYNYYRHTYLPPGEWRSIWNGQRYEGGGAHVVPSDLDTIPVFARAGTILPLLDGSPRTLLPANDIPEAGNDLRLNIYPGNDGHFVLYDGTEFRWDDGKRTLTVSSNGAQRHFSVSVIDDGQGAWSRDAANGLPVATRGSTNGPADAIRPAAATGDAHAPGDAAGTPTPPSPSAPNYLRFGLADGGERTVSFEPQP